MAAVEVLTPSLAQLPGYVDALTRGWSPDNVRGAAFVKETLERIDKDPQGFVDALVDREAKGPPITMPDGSKAARLPGYQLWISDGGFCGVIGFRWQPGTPVLPPHVLGHLGYAVVPWKRGHGYATAALRRMLEHVRAERLPYVELTTDPDNIASRKVIEANGGVFLERFTKPPQYGGVEGLRFRIPL
jgi:predicted acetyltransferase